MKYHLVMNSKYDNTRLGRRRGCVCGGGVCVWRGCVCVEGVCGGERMWGGG